MQVLQELQDGNAEVRLGALRRIWRGTPDPRFRAALLRIARTDPATSNRFQAVLALEPFVDEPEVRAALLACLGDEEFVAEAAVEVLIASGDPYVYVQLAKAFVCSSDRSFRLFILKHLSGAPQAFLVAFLKKTQVLRSPDERLRAAAVSMLKDVGNPTLKGIFLSKLEDPCPRVRANALEALEAVCSRDEMARIASRYVNDSDNRIRANAVLALLKLGSRRAEGCLEAMLRHGDARFRASAAWVLGCVAASTRQLAWLKSLLFDHENAVVDRAEMSILQLGRCPMAA